mmetsp:Transcript_76497/g.206695  ORF Transcript_76497/g.206695 Transcript_76497/m.206695 type:complete len:211 (-) Transcript_76497:532-1164(-)
MPPITPAPDDRLRPVPRVVACCRARLALSRPIRASKVSSSFRAISSSLLACSFSRRALPSWREASRLPSMPSLLTPPSSDSELESDELPMSAAHFLRASASSSREPRDRMDAFSSTEPLEPILEARLGRAFRDESFGLSPQPCHSSDLELSSDTLVTLASSPGSLLTKLPAAEAWPRGTPATMSSAIGWSGKSVREKSEKLICPSQSVSK